LALRNRAIEAVSSLGTARFFAYSQYIGMMIGHCLKAPPLAQIAAGLLAVALAGCGEGPKQAAAPPPPAVTVSYPVKRTIIDLDEYVGRFVPLDSVEIRARVSGYLDKVLFTDGQIVKAGDPLFAIDRRPFENSLAQAQGNLAQAKASLAFTEADLARASQLVRERTITEQAFDQRTQAKRIAEASVAANEAQVRQATLDLEFTQLRAPISGHIGDRRVSPGNLVTGGTGGNTTLLATIVSTDPIRLEFTVDESSHLRYERMAMTGKDKASNEEPAEVMLKLIDEKAYTHKGKLDFVDNVIERSTGTIRLRATFENSKGLFTPGMFARVQVPGSPPYEALLIPEVAIGTEQVRKFVYVVGADDVVAQKYVTLGDARDGLRVIREGLTAGDRVIVNGIPKARPGLKVAPQEDKVPAPTAQR
jgi:membrane fusion protein, multidrug efflux system